MKHSLVLRTTLTALVALAALILTACGGQAAATSWPGLIPGDGVVYLTASTKTYAINVADGTKKWEFQHTVPQAGLFGTGNATDQMHAPPALGDNLVYVGTDGGYLLALDVTTGTEKWQFLAETPATFIPFIREKPSPVYAGPALAGKLVIFAGTANKVYALDAATGKLVWDSSVNSRVWGTPLVVGDTVYVPTLTHKLYALDVATGTPRWVFDKPQGALAGAPTLDNRTIYVGSFDNHLYAVNADNGSLRWSFNANNWVWEGPAVVSGTLYFGDVSGNVYALDAATQQLAWPQPFQVGGAVRAMPLYADGILYIGTDSGALYALNAITSQPVWPQPFMVSNARFLTTPMIEGGLLLVAPLGTPTLLYGLNPTNAQTQWQFPTPTSK